MMGAQGQGHDAFAYGLLGLNVSATARVILRFALWFIGA